MCGADIDEEIQELRDQLEDEIEYSTEMYERAQLAEAELTTIRADMATSKVTHSRPPSQTLSKSAKRALPLQSPLVDAQAEALAASEGMYGLYVSLWIPVLAGDFAGLSAKAYRAVSYLMRLRGRLRCFAQDAVDGPRVEELKKELAAARIDTDSLGAKIIAMRKHSRALESELSSARSGTSLQDIQAIAGKDKKLVRTLPLHDQRLCVCAQWS